MLEDIRKKVYGLDEYEKVKIDERFLSIKESLSSISVTSLDELEDLEDCIYKIKELLRVKSSNLNKVIRDPSRNIRRKDVLEILDSLVDKKKSVLSYLFQVVQEREQIPVAEPVVEHMPEPTTEEIEEPTSKEPLIEEPDKEFIPVQKEEPITTLKEEEDSLDSLLEKVHHVEPEIIKPKEEPREPIHVEVHKEEPVVVEKKSFEEEPEFSVETRQETESKPFTLYEDDIIRVYLDEYSEVPGEMVIESVKDTALKAMDDNDISYITLFSKIFASTIFEVGQAQGTNIIGSFNDTFIRIVPRYTNDNIALKWDSKKASDEFLDQIQKRLIDEMTKELTKEEPQQEEREESSGDLEKEIEKTPQESSGSQAEFEEKKEKLNQILKALKRIPR